MNTRHAVPTMLLGAAAAIGLLAGARPAGAVTQGPYSLEVLVDGRPLDELHGNGRSYVEASAGHEYAVRLTNNTGNRVAIALAVDGLNSIDARTTTAGAAAKWILAPYETIVLDGWQTTADHARRFFFTTERKSYGAWLGKTANLGVITAAVFRERRPVIQGYAPSSPLRRGGTSDVPGGAAADSAGAPAPAPPQSEAHSEPEAKGLQANAGRVDEYAATGIGREVDHEVSRVAFDAEHSPAAVLELRYEYRPALAKLGLLPRACPSDPLDRRERARGFESGFAPDPYRSCGEGH